MEEGREKECESLVCRGKGRRQGAGRGNITIALYQQPTYRALQDEDATEDDAARSWEAETGPWGQGMKAGALGCSWNGRVTLTQTNIRVYLCIIQKRIF